MSFLKGGREGEGGGKEGGRKGGRGGGVRAGGARNFVKHQCCRKSARGCNLRKFLKITLGKVTFQIIKFQSFK